MAKFRVSPELVKVLLPLVLPVLKDLAAKTTTTVDDKLVAALEQAANNPVLMALLLSLLANETPAPLVASSDAEVRESAAQLEDNADLLRGLFSVAKEG
jgi:hypothetical protein